MTDLTQPMTETEAREKHAQLKSLTAVLRALFLEMRDRKGYLMLGYPSFEAYGEAEFNYSASHIYRLAAAAEIQQSLNSPIGETEIPETQLRPLKKVPAKERQAIWDEAMRKAQEEGKELTAKAVQEAVADYQKQLDEAQGKLQMFETNIISVIEQQKQQSQAEIDEQLRKTIAEKEDEFGSRFESLERELHSDYTAKIDNQKDEISRLKNELTKLQQKSHADKDWEKAEQYKNELTNEIAALSESIEKLNASRESAANQMHINKLHQDVARQVSSFLSEVDVKLLLFQCGEKNYQPPILTDETKLLLSYAANALISAEKGFRFLATSKVEDFSHD